jgi:hypothetical protein
LGLPAWRLSSPIRFERGTQLNQHLPKVSTGRRHAPDDFSPQSSITFSVRTPPCAAHPHLPLQNYCNGPEFQRERRKLWQKQKRQSDKDYQANLTQIWRRSLRRARMSGAPPLCLRLLSKNPHGPIHAGQFVSDFSTDLPNKRAARGIGGLVSDFIGTEHLL